MENDNDMRRLLEHFVPTFCRKVGVNFPNIIVPDLFVPSDQMPVDFFQNLMDVMEVKKYINIKKWYNFFAISCLKALSSHEMYFRYVFFACEYAISFCDDVFDRILSVFALVINYTIETLINSELNFCKFIVDICVLFYEVALKEEFYRHGGFTRFAEYLRHEYREWECYFSYFNAPDENKPSQCGEKLNQKLTEALGRIAYQPEFITHDDVMMNSNCESLTEQLLSSTKIKLPSLINLPDLKNRMRDIRLQRMSVIERTNRRNRVVSKRETSKTNLIPEKAESEVKFEKTESDSKSEETETDLKREKIKTHSKPDKAESDSKLEKTNAGMKLQKIESDSELEKAGADIKREKIESDSKREKAQSDWKREKIESDSKRDKTDADLKREKIEAGLKGQKMRECAKSESLVVIPQEKSGSNSDFKINYMIENEADATRYNNIIEAVIRYNKLKSSNSTERNNGIPVEFDELLRPLKDMIKSLIEVLVNLTDK